MLKERITKADLYETKNRIKYLRQIIKQEISLKPGELHWLKNPCDLSDNIRSIGGKFTKMGEGAYGKVFRVCIDKLCEFEFILKEIEYKKKK